MAKTKKQSMGFKGLLLRGKRNNRSDLELGGDNKQLNLPVPVKERTVRTRKKTESTLGGVKSLLQNSAFLVIWVVVQYGLQLVRETLTLYGVAFWFLFIFQIVFGFSTIIPIIIRYYRDISIRWIKAKKDIRTAKKDSKINDDDIS